MGAQSDAQQNKGEAGRDTEQQVMQSSRSAQPSVSIGCPGISNPAPPNSYIGLVWGGVLRYCLIGNTCVRLRTHCMMTPLVTTRFALLQAPIPRQLESPSVAV